MVTHVAEDGSFPGKRELTLGCGQVVLLSDSAPSFYFSFETDKSFIGLGSRKNGPRRRKTGGFCVFLRFHYLCK